MAPLKIAIVSFSEKGGAGIAARRLFAALQKKQFRGMDGCPREIFVE